MLIATGAVMLAACGGDGDAASRSDGSVVVTDVWARATPPGTTVGAVYLTATSDTADSLTGADVDPAIAASATLHSTETSGGMSMMTAQSTLEIPTGDVLALEPSGSHIMLVDLTGPLESGTTFDLTLHFEQAGDETVTVEVRDDAP
ncbi:MAG: copper chaperone PCu(A)C [Ilumatobacteraceae bacterium]